MTGGPDVPGRVEISARALTSCARAVAAERLGAPARRVRVDIGDAVGALALEIVGPVTPGPDLVGRVTRVADEVRDRVSELTGRRVGRTHIEVTGLVRERDGRVQ